MQEYSFSEIHKELIYKLFDDKSNLELQKKYLNEYGGSYLDEKGILNINILHGGRNIKKIIQNQNVKYHDVKFTYMYLKEIYNMLSEQMKDLNIYVVELDERNNKVIIYLKDLEDSQEIDKFISDLNAIEYKKADFIIDVYSGSH